MGHDAKHPTDGKKTPQRDKFVPGDIEKTETAAQTEDTTPEDPGEGVRVANSGAD